MLPELISDIKVPERALSGRDPTAILAFHHYIVSGSIPRQLTARYSCLSPERKLMPYYDNDQSDEGRACVYYGNGGAGLSLNPRQRWANDGAPIAHLGRSDSDDLVRLALLGRSPFGRARVKLEW